jgi:hypothetical protein
VRLTEPRGLSVFRLHHYPADDTRIGRITANHPVFSQKKDVSDLNERLAVGRLCHSNKKGRV